MPTWHLSLKPSLAGVDAGPRRHEAEAERGVVDDQRLSGRSNLLGRKLQI